MAATKGSRNEARDQPLFPLLLRAVFYYENRLFLDLLRPVTSMKLRSNYLIAIKTF